MSFGFSVVIVLLGFDYSLFVLLTGAVFLFLCGPSAPEKLLIKGRLIGWASRLADTLPSTADPVGRLEVVGRGVMAPLGGSGSHPP
jgi:hypothetical protein